MKKKLIFVLIITIILAALAAGFVYFKKDTPEIVCLGDSITYGYNSEKSYPSYLSEIMDSKVVNKGICGITSEKMIEKYKKLVTEDTKTVVILIGINDIFYIEYSEYKPQKNIEEMVSWFQSENIDIVLCTYPENRAENFFSEWTGQEKEQFYTKFEILNEDIRIISEKYNTQLVDLNLNFNGFREEYDLDGVHLNSEGNKAIAEFVKNVLTIS